MKKLKIGFIGCGGIAFDKHLPGMATQTDKIDMYAFCDIIAERAEEARQKYGCTDAKMYTDYHELLEDPEIYAVHVLYPQREALRDLLCRNGSRQTCHLRKAHGCHCRGCKEDAGHIQTYWQAADDWIPIPAL